jgi:hypothetical protein
VLESGEEFEFPGICEQTSRKKRGRNISKSSERKRDKKEKEKETELKGGIDVTAISESKRVRINGG